MKAVSVRTKLTLWNIGVLAVTLGALGLGVFYGARQSLLASVDRDLRSRADRTATRVTTQIERTEGRPERGIRIVGVDKGNPRIEIPGLPESLATFQIGKDTYEAESPPPQPNNDPTRAPFRPRILDPAKGKTREGDKPYDPATFEAAKQGSRGFSTALAENNEKVKERVRVYTIPLVAKSGKLLRILQYPQALQATDQALAGLTLTLLTVLPLILVVAALGGAFLAGRALKPVRDITDAAGKVGAESLDERLEVKGNDEFSRLAQTFNGMLGRLQGAFGRMEQAVEQQRRFTADASHELRTPLTVIKANTSLAMKRQRTAEEYQKSLAAVNAAADTMSRLVNDLLLLARSDTGRLELKREPTCLKPLLKEAIAAVFRPGIAEITLGMAEEGVEIDADGHSILRVFVNLLENAARYTPEDGRITIDQTRDNAEVVISVSDSGIGIAPEHVPHLTDRFYRVDDARARDEGGNGLGLSICASIVESHRGSMEIASEPNQGTTVIVRLPAV